MKFLIVLYIVHFTFALKGKQCEKYNDYSILVSCPENKDVFSNTSDMIKRHGYPVEEHEVVTEDKYVLTIYRIPNPSGQLVFLQHGAFASSEWWVNTGNNSLGFRLASKGYDVWIGNTRGNFNSMKNKRLNTSDSAFWDYSIDDMGNYDLPAVFKTINEVTNRKGKIIYIGHSQGTTEAMIYAINKNREAKHNLKALILLAPVAYIPKDNLAFNNIFKILEKFNIEYVGSKSDDLTNFLQNAGLLMRGLAYLTNSFYGKTNYYEPALMPVFFRYLMYGESTKPIKQFDQMAKSGLFQEYNSGAGEPKTYDLKKITVPVYLFVGENDALGTLKNAKKIEKQVKNSKLIILEKYNHMNFFFASNIYYFYEKLDNVLKSI